MSNKSEDYKLCSLCAKNDILKKHIEDIGNENRCTMCSEISKYVVSVKMISNLFKTLIRYYYNETEYNTHFGGEDISHLLAIPNEILNHERFPNYDDISLETGDVIDFSCFIDELVDPVYPDSEDEGVSLFFGWIDDGIRWAYSDTLQESESLHIKRLAESLQRTNYYEYESEWLELLEPILSSIEVQLPAGEIKYRARIGVHLDTFKVDESMERGTRVVFPYENHRIGAPNPEFVKPSRLNRSSISFLYLADSIETAIAEVRPHPGHLVSIGKFESVEEMKYVDFTDISIFNYCESDKQIDSYLLLRNIEQMLSKPVTPGSQAEHYTTQFLADIIRRLHYDGIRFSSSVCNGYNLLIYKPDKFKYIEKQGIAKYVKSLRYEVKDVQYETEHTVNHDSSYWCNGNVLAKRDFKF